MWAAVCQFDQADLHYRALYQRSILESNLKYTGVFRLEYETAVSVLRGPKHHMP
jgi:hypothetical protein